MKLSIITINYNNLDGLRRTIDSVIHQTWQEFEWIIVDGGSTDGSRELIEETVDRLSLQGWHTEQFSLLDFTADVWKGGLVSIPPSRETNSRTLLWCSDKDNGIYNAMNKGIVMAQGEYCQFLNSGDCLASDSALALVFKDDKVRGDVVYGNLRVLAQENNIWSIPIRSVNGRHFYSGKTLPHPASFFRRLLFCEFGLYDEGLKVVSDWKFYAVLAMSGCVTFEHIPVVISVFDGGGISSNTELLITEKAKVMHYNYREQITEDYAMADSLSLVRKYTVLRALYALLYRIAYQIENHRHRNPILLVSPT